MEIENNLISIIIPVFNGENCIEACFEGILSQTSKNPLEICICNDASSDNTLNICEKWKKKFEAKGVKMAIFNNNQRPGGVGYSKNRAVSISSGEFLCFQDADDIMLPDRISLQLDRALQEDDYTIVGSKFRRSPENSTLRYTNWANSLTNKELNNQIFTSHGPTIIMPTWFCRRSIFDRVGGFKEEVLGMPEDLIFFYKHLDLNGKVCRVDKVLLIYTYNQNSATFSVLEKTIWDLRIERLESKVICNWQYFTIWNAGKQGRTFYNSLSSENKNKVLAFCDVDLNKIGKTYQHYDSLTRKVGRTIDIIHFKEAQKPFIICVKMGLTNGKFEENLATLNLEEGRDYVMFS